MARQCTICSHEKRKAIESDRKNNTTYRTVADRYHVSETSLKRHFASHVPHEQEIEAPESIRDVVRKTNRIESLTDRTYVGFRPSGQHIETDIKPGVQTAFLAAFVELANETGACRAVRISRETVRYWEEFDVTFSVRYHDAQSQVNDSIRAEVWRRGVAGYEKTVVTPKGDEIIITEYSDRMLELLAKSRMRSEFGDKSAVDVTSNGATVGQGVSLTDLAILQEQVAARLCAWRQGRVTYDDLGPT